MSPLIKRIQVGLKLRANRKARAQTDITALRSPESLFSEKGSRSGRARREALVSLAFSKGIRKGELSKADFGALQRAAEKERARSAENYRESRRLKTKSKRLAELSKEELMHSEVHADIANMYEYKHRNAGGKK